MKMANQLKSKMKDTENVSIYFLAMGVLSTIKLGMKIKKKLKY